MPETKQSFLRGLFAGAIHDPLLFPYPPPLDETDPAEARVVRRLIGELQGMQESGLIDSARFDEEESVPEEVIEGFARIGLLGISIPEAYGGLGLSPAAYARVFAAVSAIDPSCGVLVGVHCGLGAKAIALYGSDEQKARYLPMLARGETLAAYALTEPETGSDAQHIVTRATRGADGGWVLNGRKHWIGNGHRAGVIATFAQTEIERKGERVSRPTAFIIRPDMPGFEVVGTVRKMGIRGSTQAELRYTNLAVPADHVLGETGKGFAVAVNVLNAGRLSLASGCTAGTKQVLGHMAAYAEQRIQFGAPLASFEITQRKLASIAADVYASDAMVGHLAAIADRPDVDHALEAAVAKVFASELLWRAADEMVQVAGGRGYVKPYPYERLLRDVRINRIFEGANEVLRLFIALNGIQGPAEQLKEVGAALRRPIENWGIVTGYATQRVRWALGASDGVDTPLHPRLEEHRRYFEKHVRQLKEEAQRAILKHKKRIIERQLVVERLANMAIELYATAATVARTQRLIEERGAERCERELALCDLFCVESGRRFRVQREALAGREDEVDDRRRAVAATVRETAGYVVTDAIMETAADPAAPSGDGVSAGAAHETAGARGVGGN